MLGGTLTATAQNGVAKFAGLTLTKAGTGYTLRVSSTGLAGATTNAFEVKPLAPTQLVLTTQPPSSVTVGLEFGLAVAAEDQFDNVDTNFGSSVTVALSNNPGGATLGGTHSVTAQNGVATFSGLTLNVVGIGYTLEVASNGLLSATTNAFNANLPTVPTVYTVDLTSANGTGSGNAGDLVYTIGLANANPTPGGSIIQFDPTVFATAQMITLTSTLVLTETAGPEVIEGLGANVVTVSGNNSVEVFSVASGVTATISGLTISGGSATEGGGIDNGGTLTVTDSTIAGNSASVMGGFGGGIDNGGTLTVTDSTIADNYGGYGGGGISNDGGTLMVTNSTIADNSAYNGGGILNFSALTLTNSTVADNAAHNGGGIDNSGGTLKVTNSTIASNNVFSGGAGGGLDGTATLDNTIVALNTMDSGTTTSASDIAGTVSSTSAYNLVGTGGSGGLISGINGNMVGVADPGLAPNGLQDYGGPTQTIALLAGSPAIAAGSPALAVDPVTGQPLSTDQRGIGFPRMVNNTVDIGDIRNFTRSHSWA